ncbi:TetR/AcrR family transcriptional regulator [Baekduia soli]|uniref:TetR/AcrR family transcriptional regulator n=1 Tax=Baekduia soli TaxID=496014 RepID=A0A5B8U2D3_9ACTN|nr:TetR/AcrR family transcriptional regulator [Baekduia soli]QEC47177.1 TetR/AcrR family transcriptional regulator [Baekduia soli]
MLDSSDVTRLDGRAARSQRSRLAIVDALIALLQEGNVQPKIEDIAARAGVASRTVFGHYPDGEALFAAVGERQARSLEALLTPIAPGGPLAERAAAVALQRATLYEAIAPVRRAALLMEPLSPSVQATLERFRAAKRAAVLGVFAAELDAMDPARRDAAAAALGAAASWAAWDALRRQQGLSVDAARAALQHAVGALVRPG